MRSSQTYIYSNPTSALPAFKLWNLGLRLKSQMEDNSMKNAVTVVWLSGGAASISQENATKFRVRTK